ncbi:MAG: DoxX family protein [Trueperaceae bacterium]|nr:DoxX family protein [Trueperaceae bacterium]
MKQAELSTWGITILRVSVGIIFLMNGWVKLFVNGIAGTAGFFDSIGIPLATAAAVVVSVLEFAGGAALILGVGTRLVSPLLAVVMLTALFTVHIGNGFFVSNGGISHVFALLAATLTLTLTGPGRLALADLVTSRGAGTPEAA